MCTGLLLSRDNELHQCTSPTSLLLACLRVVRWDSSHDWHYECNSLSWGSAWYLTTTKHSPANIDRPSALHAEHSNGWSALKDALGAVCPAALTSQQPSLLSQEVAARSCATGEKLRLETASAGGAATSGSAPAVPAAPDRAGGRPKPAAKAIAARCLSHLDLYMRP